MNETLAALGINHIDEVGPTQLMRAAMAEPNPVRKSLIIRVAIIRGTALEAEHMDRLVLRSTMRQLTDEVMQAEGVCLMPFCDDPVQGAALTN